MSEIHKPKPKVYIACDIEKTGSMLIKHKVNSIGFYIEIVNSDRSIIEETYKYNISVKHPTFNEDGECIDYGDFEPRCWNEFWGKLDKDILKELFIYDAVIISDYNKGFLLEEDIESILNACSIYEVPTFLDTKKKAGEFADKTFCVKINEKEYNLSPEWPLHCQNLIVTLGGDGARFSSKFLRSISKINGYKVDVSSIIGCGDCFLASLVLKYLETKDFRQSIDFANYCAAISASKPGVFFLIQ